MKDSPPPRPQQRAVRESIFGGDNRETKKLASLVLGELYVNARRERRVHKLVADASPLNHPSGGELRLVKDCEELNIR